MRKTVVAIVVLSLAVLTGCSKNSVSPVTPATTGLVQVMMTDAPAAFDAVNLVISEVSVNTGSGWQVLDNQVTTVDLLSLRNGHYALLAQGAVPAGEYGQIRLKLAEGSNVVVGGVTYPLEIPSGMQTGIKINGAFGVTGGGSQTLQMDFDAANSIHQTGNGSYVLSPVIRMLPATDAGAIAGQITTDGADAMVQVQDPNTGDVVASTTANPDGTFSIGVLPAGYYTVTFTSTRGRLSILQDVYIQAGQTVTFGSIAFRS